MYKKEQRNILFDLVSEFCKYMSFNKFDLKELSRTEIYLRGVIAGIYLCDQKLCVGLPKFNMDPDNHFMITVNERDIKDKIKKTLRVDW